MGAIKVYVTNDMCETFNDVVNHEEFSEEFTNTHLALAWVVNNFNNQYIDTTTHWLYVVDMESKNIII